MATIGHGRGVFSSSPLSVVGRFESSLCASPSVVSSSSLLLSVDGSYPLSSNVSLVMRSFPICGSKLVLLSKALVEEDVSRMAGKSRLESSAEVEALISKGIQMWSAVLDALKSLAIRVPFFAIPRWRISQGLAVQEFVLMFCKSYGYSSESCRKIAKMMQSKPSSCVDKDASLWPLVAINFPTVKALVSNCIVTTPGAVTKHGAEDYIGVALEASNRFLSLENPIEEAHRKDPTELEDKGIDLTPVTHLQSDALGSISVNEGCLQVPGVKGLLVEPCF
ncbi:hypothetical protein Nepgr_030859 [Nepenthes gracilis]|uniref:Uncharacterized protein n=1 Tax=Nepenthes gracilis TaxID=150966 RepID=A0AAD3THD7_NEPGR|nr:hypothetical protein Nepgr_030859 [Nepenthes gracilis]